MIVMCFATTFRLGEASNPGPFVGSLNPTGVMGKSSELKSLPPGIWAIQETHLTREGISKFKQELAWSETNLTLHHGHPAPPQSASIKSIGGKQTGVAVVSNYPTRTLHHDWQQTDHETARCTVAASYMQQNWVTMGTVYGYSERANTLEVQQNTDRLLLGLTERVIDGATGMRVVAGDWNLERKHVVQADYWETKGWIEAQDLAQKLWFRPPIATCRRSTIKDYVYLSPELIPHVIDVCIDWSMFPDHAVIKVHLADLSRPSAIPIWKMPSPIPWPSKPMEAAAHWVTSPAEDQSSQQWYENIAMQLEQYADAQLPNRLTSKQKGRSLG